MFVIAGTVAVTTAVVVRLITAVRGDHPSSPPRSHHHDVDQYTMRFV